MAFCNLKAEMIRSGISQRDVADLLGMSLGSTNKKVNEMVPMTIQEAISIKERFFPDSNLDYLFASENKGREVD